MTTPFDNFINHLESQGFSYDQSTGRGQCPGHGTSDSGFNLAVTEGDSGHVLLRCFSHGCDASKICQNMGIPESDLFAGKDYQPSERVKKEGRRLETPGEWVDLFERSLGYPSKIYDYCEATGEVIGQVLRYDKDDGSKEFRQISVTADGMWEAKGMALPRPIYNLPDVTQADLVYVVEGEKAADALTDLGVVATTGTQGSSSPQKSDWSVLEGKTVIVLPDNDVQGDLWYKKMMTLLPDSCNVRVVALADQYELPEGGDAADISDPDLIDAINGMDPIEERSVNTALGKFSGQSVGELWEVCEEEIDWIVEGAFSVDQPTVIGAKQKSLKTTLLSDLAVALATGTPWVGYFQVPRKRRTLFITGESSARGSMRRIRRAVESRGLGRYDVGDELRIETMHFPNLPDPEDCDAVSEAVLRFGIEVVIVDPLYMGLSGVSTTNLTEVGPALRRFKEACTPAAMILAHHVKKSTDYSDAPNLEDLSQAGIAEFAGNYMLLGRLSEYMGDGKHELAIRMGGRDDQFGLHKLDFDETDWTARFMDLVEWREHQKADKEADKAAAKERAAAEKIRSHVCTLLKNGGYLDLKTLGKKRKSYQSVIDQMVDEGTLEVDGDICRSPSEQDDYNSLFGD